jgi:hypothetical protein
MNCLILLAVYGSACRQNMAGPVVSDPRDESPPPLEIRFKPSQGLCAKEGEVSCGVPEGRDQVYDPNTGIFHVHFKVRNFTAGGFEITKVAQRFPKPIVFRLTGIPLAYGCVGVPLALTVGEKRYPMIDVGHDSFHAYDRIDRTLFRVERKEDVVTVEFTDKGRALLEVGAQVSFKVDTGW